MSHTEINNNNKHSLRNNTKGNGGKPHYTDSQNNDTTAPNSRELYRLQFSLQATSPETYGYTLVSVTRSRLDPVAGSCVHDNEASNSIKGD